ncbi:MAG: SPOR domain-containing protein [Geoalkalibacter sp.]|uniref:SPOR domain-containing protein n=1 Tax=Geoalkalibacter sp. TaxID=3041440 RepID=UPI003D12EBF5
MTGKDDVKKETDQQTESAQQGPQPEKDVQVRSGDVPNEPVSPRAQGRSLRLLLLVLLLVVLAAVAWFVYFAPQQSMHFPGTAGESVAKRETRPIPRREKEVSRKPQAQSQAGTGVEVASSSSDQKEHLMDKPDGIAEPIVEKQAIPRPAAKTQPQPIPGTDAPEGGAVAEKKEGSTSATEEALQTAAHGDSDSSARGSVQDTPTGKVSEGEKTVPSLSGTDSGPAAESGQAKPASGQAVSSEKPREKAVARGVYTVQVGAYSVPAYLAADQKKLHDLGFETLVLETQRPIRMVRLRVGTFFPSQGEAQIARLTELGAEPFFVKDGDLMVVYAGSFRSEDRAERLSRRLAEAGVHVEVERTSVDVPLSILRFGPFESFSAARSAARKAEDAGLETLIVKMR